MSKEIAFWWWRFRVCWFGFRWHGHWVWSHLSREEWEEGFDELWWRSEPGYFYVENWGRG